MKSQLIVFVVVVLCLSLNNSTAFSEQPQSITNSLGMKLVLIPKGTFMMGFPGEKGTREAERQHPVTISQDFYLGATEVTQAQFQRVMGTTPSRFRGREVAKVTPAVRRSWGLRPIILEEKVVFVDSSHHPVENVSWVDAVEFCRRLSEFPEEKSIGRVYRLPSEAEWEYACRAGSKTSYSFSAEPGSLGDYAWFRGNSSRRTHPVGQKKPNAWGLYDMHGNVWEWCSDWYGAYPDTEVTDSRGPNEGLARVHRGGSWITDAEYCQSATRDKFDQSFSYYDVGFRIALSPVR